MRVLPAVLLFITFLVISEPLAAQFAGGSGTSDDPYQIENLEQLQEMKNYTDSHFILIGDIDASATSDWNEGEGFIPIGDPDTPFTGTFDGNGHEITGFRILRFEEIKLPRDFLGLFGYLQGAEVKNLTMSGLVVSSGMNTMYVGGIAGYSDENSVITNVSVEGSVNALVISGAATKRYFGGIAGMNDGEIYNSRFSGTVGGSGGVAGHHFGGIAGTNSGVIEQSYALSNSQANGYAGGVTGSNQGTINKSFSLSPERIHGGFAIGGFAGYNSGIITNSYTHPAVTGGRDGTIGGFVAANSGQIAYSYSTGSVHQNAVAKGGFAARNTEGTITGSFWDTDRSETDFGIEEGDASGLTGLTTSQMTGSNAAQYMLDLDFGDTWQHTGTYPALQWQGDDQIYDPEIDLSVEDPEDEEMPKTIELLQNYPNPFNATTTIHFRVNEPVDHATFSIYNSAGQKVMTLFDEELPALEFELPIDFSHLPSGTYFLKVTSTANSDFIQMSLIK